MNGPLRHTGRKDVAIVGAGPAGLFAVFQCGMMGLSCAVFDSLEDIGGQCAALYPEKPIYDIPSQPSITGENLTARLEEQARPFNPAYHLGQQIVSIKNDNGFWLVESAKTAVEVKAIIIAAGAGAFGPNRPPIDNIGLYEGRGVQYMVRRKDDLKGKKIVIAGGGDSAIDWTLSLSGIAEHIHLVHRRDKFRASPESVQQMKTLVEQGTVTLCVPYQIGAVNGKDGILTEVCLCSEDREPLTLETDALLLFFGLAPDLGPVLNWNLDVHDNQIPVDPSTCATVSPGIYAIGDIASYKNKQKLILTGFHEAAMTAHAIREQIYPDKIFHFEHSTTKGLP